MLVGGLGLGFTVSEILAVADSAGVEVEIDVVEIEECLIDWARAGVTPTLAAVAADPRVRLHAADIRSVLSGSPHAEAGAPGLTRAPVRSDRGMRSCWTSTTVRTS